MTVCNMSVEAGAKAGFIAPDEKVFAYLKDRPKAPKGKAWDEARRYWDTLASDEDAPFDREIRLDAARETRFEALAEELSRRVEEARAELAEGLDAAVSGRFDRIERALADLPCPPGRPAGLVYAGISWGEAKAQQLAQTRPGARGALLYEACIPITGEWAFGPWPDGVPVQIHGAEKDPFFGLEGDLDAARELVQIVGSPQAELFVYPGDQHLFTDNSLPSGDADATALVLQRSLAFLDRIG